ncbi:MAG: endonuclease/exonuclease/phosphatase family protein, partial [Proteobacteria bacterium]
MMIKRLIAVFVILFAITSAKSQEKKYKVHTVAFYNLENLFDTINGPNNDEEYLPS